MLETLLHSFTIHDSFALGIPSTLRDWYDIIHDRFSFFNLYSISFFLDAKTWIALSLASFVIHAPLCHVRPRHTKASLVDEQLLDEKSTVTGLEQSRLGSVSAWTAGVEPDRSHMRVWERQSFRFDTVKTSMSAVSESALRVCCQAERGESV